MTTIDALRMLPRGSDIPHTGIIFDLMWNEPEWVDGWSIQQAGAGFLFGEDIVREFLHRSALEWMVRAHQLVMEGYRWEWDKKALVTVFSTPNYCHRAEK